MKIDLSGVQSSGFDPLPAGTYHVKLTDGEIKESGPNAKNPGAEYINFEFTVQGDKYEGRKLWAIASLLPQALYTLKNIVDASGFEGDVDSTSIIGDLMGVDLLAVVKIRPASEEYEAKNEIKRFRKFDASAVGTATDSLLP